jgi:hypothetical protein
LIFGLKIENCGLPCAIIAEDGSAESTLAHITIDVDRSAICLRGVSNVRVRDAKIVVGGGSAVVAERSNGVSLKNVSVEGTSMGKEDDALVDLVGGRYHELIDLTVRNGSGSGLRLTSVDDATVEWCTFEFNRIGIVLNNVSKSLFSTISVADSSEYGIYGLSRDSGNRLTDIAISRSGQDGLVLRRKADAKP